jgi:hypothetical protein
VSVDGSVIAALESALDADAGAHAVRLHLASMLVMAGDPRRALDHAGIVLSALPDSVEALIVSRDAARALGDEPRAAAYERLLGVAAPSNAPRPADGDGRVAADAGDAEHGPLVDEGEPPTITLADVGGLAHVKERLELAFLAPLRNPEARAYYGKSLRGGLLLYGPPGMRQDVHRTRAGRGTRRSISRDRAQRRPGYVAR